MNPARLRTRQAATAALSSQLADCVAVNQRGNLFAGRDDLWALYSDTGPLDSDRGIWLL